MTTFTGPPATSVAVGSLTLGGFLDEVAGRFADHEALVFDDPQRDGATVRWSYTDLRRETQRVAAGLIAEGVVPGERVAVLMGNRPEAVAAIFGAAIVGAVAAPLSTFATRPELAHLLDLTEATVLLTQTLLLDGRPAEDAVAVLAEPHSRPRLRRIVAVGPDHPPTVTGWDEFLAGGAAVTGTELDAGAAAVEPDDPGLVICSSGTTSAAKGILHTHRAPARQFWVQAQIFGRDEATRMWTALPLFWTAGLNTAMGATLAAGGCWVMQETFAPGAALVLMARERVTEPYTLPHQTAALEEHPAWASTDLSSLRCVFGKSALARHPTVSGDTSWSMPVGYGLSETCAFVCAHWSDASREARARSMGQLLPGNELRVVDPDSGRLLGAGEDGELAVKGPTLMLRYLGQTPEECLDADGFFHTGDAGFVDDRGEVHFTGRRTEMIKTGGANVSPAELEVALRACPPVKLARAVGVPDPRLDQAVALCVVLKDGAHATADDVTAFLRERVAAYKVPKHVLFFADGEIPMTASDTKVRDDELLALVAARLPEQDPVPITSGDR